MTFSSQYFPTHISVCILHCLVCAKYHGQHWGCKSKWKRWWLCSYGRVLSLFTVYLVTSLISILGTLLFTPPHFIHKCVLPLPNSSDFQNLEESAFGNETNMTHIDQLIHTQGPMSPRLWEYRTWPRSFNIPKYVSASHFR